MDDDDESFAWIFRGHVDFRVTESEYLRLVAISFDLSFFSSRRGSILAKETIRRESCAIILRFPPGERCEEAKAK